MKYKKYGAAFRIGQMISYSFFSGLVLTLAFTALGYHMPFAKAVLIALAFDGLTCFHRFVFD